jgi:hypothetical protein
MIESLGIICGAIIALCTVLVGTYKVIRAIYRFGKRGHEAFERLRVVEEYALQLTPNSGSHLADSVNRTEAAVRTLTGKMDAHVKVSDRRFRALELDRADIWKSIAAKDVIDTATHVLAIPAKSKDDTSR